MKCIFKIFETVKTIIAYEKETLFLCNIRAYNLRLR